MSGNLDVSGSNDVLPADIKLDALSESDSSSTKPASKQQENNTDKDDIIIPRPTFHPPASQPFCHRCSVYDHEEYFSRECRQCEQNLETASIPEIFAVVRQWSSDIQQDCCFYLEKLLSRGCGINDYDSVSGCTLLHFMAKAGGSNISDGENAAKCTQSLLDKGANIHMKDLWTGMMPLHYAAMYNSPQVLEKILNHRSQLEFDVNYEVDEWGGVTALHISCMNLCYDSARILLAKGASVECKNKNGLKPIELIPDVDIDNPDSNEATIARKLQKLLTSFEEKENLSIPNYDDVHGKALLLAMGIKIGDQVAIGDEKQGKLMFCGRVEFSGGVWVGVELKSGEGKHNGTVSGITYFQCPPKSGIFVPITKISKPGKVARSKPARKMSLDISYGKLDTSGITPKINTGVRSTAGSSVADNDSTAGLSRSNSACSSFAGGALDADKLVEGDRVVVAGYKRGTIRYIGHTRFASGEWYGVELDRPIGKNDGSVDGERYFACKPKKGVFVSLHKLRRAPLTRADSTDSLNSLNSLNQDTSWTMKVKRMSGGRRSNSTSIGSLNSSFNDGASGTSTPHHSTRSRSRSNSVSSMRKMSASKTKKSSEYKLEEGMTVLYNNDMAIIRFIGSVEFADGCWLGLELKTKTGKHDGTVKGKQYFTCKTNCGVMVKPTKVTVKGINGAKLLGDQYQHLNTSVVDSSSKASDVTANS